MHQLISIILGLVLFAAFAMGATVMYQLAPYGYWVALGLLGIAAWGAGFLIARSAKDAFGGIIAGLLVAAGFWFVDHSSAWATTIFHAPMLSLNSDEVLLGLALTMFGFLQGARLGERQGLQAIHETLLQDGGVAEQDTPPPGGSFGIPAPPETLSWEPPGTDDDGT